MMDSFSSWLLLVVGCVSLFVGKAVGSAPIVFTNTQEDCEACCIDASDVLFDETFCRVQGCNKTVDVNGVDVPGQNEFGFNCDAINIDFTNVQRRGCELGRDFRLLGGSDALNGAVLFCVNGAIEATSAPVVSPPPTPGPIPAASCVSCCNTLDADFDQTRSNEPFANDFQRNRCEDACNNNANCNNFRDDEEHRRRLGCALGIDFLEAGSSVLRDLELICDADGNLIIVEEDNGNNNNNDEDIIIIAASTVGGALVLAVLTLLIVRRRNRLRREKNVMRPVITSDYNWMDNLYGVRSGVYSLFSRNSRGTDARGRFRDDMY